MCVSLRFRLSYVGHMHYMSPDIYFCRKEKLNEIKYFENILSLSISQLPGEVETSSVVKSPDILLS